MENGFVAVTESLSYVLQVDAEVDDQSAEIELTVWGETGEMGGTKGTTEGTKDAGETSG